MEASRFYVDDDAEPLLAYFVLVLFSLDLRVWALGLVVLGPFRYLDLWGLWGLFHWTFGLLTLGPLGLGLLGLSWARTCWLWAP